MITPGRVEIAGAGLAGLTVAATLAQRGWSVRVHERGPELREIGAGIVLWGNALRSLAHIGAYDAVVAEAERVDNAQLMDHRHRVIQRDWLQSGEMFIAVRRQLHRAIADAALKSGVEVVTNSLVTGANPDGTLYLADGSSVSADLVIGADGVNSVVRNSLDLGLQVRNLRDGCGRHLIPRTADDPVNGTFEEWHGGRRFGLLPASPELTYIFLCCPESDVEGIQQQPFNRETWLRDYPQYRSQLERIPDVPEGRWAPFYDVTTSGWHKGRAAIIGDAAHAMSPNLGQAAAVAMTNGVALGQALSRWDVPTALDRWEESERPIAKRVQRYSRIYGRMGTGWPQPLLDARSALVWSLAASKTVQRRINFANEYEPSLAG
ncbi:MAG: monooxygenase [Modestobacter sp.]|jgi:2-polyprenyl-6-methoxyphenol hydroxylase-like FAD-dependent oxidoreductase|nr:monooxygenase [Modestobacter sp.]MCW2507508.1 monooxygenase [Modestobacter sp.]MCW2574175.1 monooxygenase [Modestobacter sp.]MCW2616916.1 monooxygenase [Modestobacter sp.]